MSGGGLLGIGVSGLQAYQRALQVTGHNIANVGNDGYSRQQLTMTPQTPQYTGFGALGSGVATTGVRRVADEFVEMRLGMNTSAEAYERTWAQFAKQLDNLLADSEAGLAPALSAFNAALEDLASDPTSTAARQQVITQAQSLVDRFGQLDARIEDQRAISNGQVKSTVDEINQLAGSVAEINRQIVEARGRSGGRDPNDLLDERDRLVRELAERTSVNTVEQSDGSLNVYIGRGQALVVGFDATELYAQPMGADPDRLDIGFRNGSSFVVATDYMSGGRLGALLDLQDSLLDPASNSLGRLAVALSESFNELHRAGMDLNGEAGRDFFSVPPPEVIGRRDNAASGSPALAVTDIGELRASDYELRHDGSDWRLIRLSDGANLGNVPDSGPFGFDGLTLDLDDVADADRGDRFVLRPLRVAADMQVEVTDPRAVAAALPVTAEAAADNAGSASLHGFSVTDPSDPALRDAVDIEFIGGEFVVDGQTFAPDPSGDTVIEANGWRAVIRGTPAEGDAIRVRDNAGAVGDNRGALALTGLANTRMLSGGTATLSEGYAELVTDVGVKTRRAVTNADVQSRLLDEAKAQRENISGVNLDEEAANLMRFQQAYQASAQVIAAAGSMFDTLLAAVRR